MRAGGRARDGRSARKLRNSFEGSGRGFGDCREHVTCWLPFLLTYRTLCLAPTPPFLLVIKEARHLIGAS